MRLSTRAVLEDYAAITVVAVQACALVLENEVFEILLSAPFCPLCTQKIEGTTTTLSTNKRVVIGRLAQTAENVEAWARGAELG